MADGTPFDDYLKFKYNVTINIYPDIGSDTIIGTKINRVNVIYDNLPTGWRLNVGYN
jgi:hypothetical protein